MFQKMLQGGGGGGGISEVKKLTNKSVYGTANSGTLTMTVSNGDFEVGKTYLLEFFQTSSIRNIDDLSVFDNVSAYGYSLDIQNFEIINETAIERYPESPEYRCKPFAKIVKAKANASITWTSREFQTNSEVGKHCLIAELG